MSQSPAGWYPQENGRQRYWDGQRWTEHFGPGAGDTPSAGATLTWHPGGAPASSESQVATEQGGRPWFRRKLVLVPAALLAFGMIGGALSGQEDPATAALGAPPASRTSSASSAPTPKAQTTSLPTVSAAEQAAKDAQADAAAKQAKADADAKAKADADAEAKAEAAAKAAKEAEAKRQAAEAKRQAAVRDRRSYPAIKSRDFALVVKSPDKYVGKKYRIFGRVSQFDSATGDDTFRADTAATKQSEWYDYDVNTLVSADDPALLADVVQDDLVTMYVEVLGSFSYDTQIGGSTTVPHVKVNIIEVTGSTK